MSAQKCSPPAQAPIQEAAANADDYADGVSNPVIDVCTAVKHRLYELNGAAEGACAYKHAEQSEPPRAG